MANDYASAIGDDQSSLGSGSTDKTGLFRKLRKLFRVDREFSAKWRKEAKEDFNFVAGEQWSEEDKEHLKSLMRPVITMNRTHTIINAVSGQEMSNQQEVRYLARELGDAKPNDLLTEAARWFYDAASGNDENSEAFLHTTICGMGWVDTSLDFDTDEAGAPDMACVNPLEMFWDRNGRKNNITDAERVWRVKKLPIAKAREAFPDADDDDDLDAKWARTEAEDDGDPKDQDRERLYNDDGDGEDADDDDQVTIVHCQYIVKVKAWDVITPLSGDKQEMSDADYKKFAKRAGELGLPLKAAKKMKRVIKDCWLGAVVLQTNEALCQDKFRYQCITGYRDETKGWFYGLVRGMKDPQRWANKWLSQTLDIMNSNAKGGLMAERGITDNARQFEKDWARPDKITWLDDGSLSGPNGARIQEKSKGEFPQGFYQLMEFSFQMIQSVPGISPELLGQTDRDQAASLEYQRRQAGMTILQPLFKNLKRYRKEQGHVVLYILQNHMSDGRLIRVLGDGQAQYVPLMKQADVKYDIVVDDAPTSPNQKELVWSMVGERFWDMPLEEQAIFLKYSPFPTSVIEEMQKLIESQSQSPQAQLQQKGMEAEVGLTLAKTQLAGAQAEKAMADAGQQPGTDPYAELALEREKEQGKLILQHNKQQGEQQIASTKTAGELQIAAEKHAGELQMAQEKHVADLAHDHAKLAMEAVKTHATVQTNAFKAREAAKIAAKKPAPRAR